MIRLKRVRTLGDIMTSGGMAGIVSGLASEIARNVSDPDPRVRATLRTQVFTERGGRGAARVIGQVGIAPYLRSVEAKRGALHRALGQSGGS